MPCTEYRNAGFGGSIFDRLQMAELWRYPVKSPQGERLDAVSVTADGLEGDRAVRDPRRGVRLGLDRERDHDVLRTIARERDARLAVGAVVVDPRTMRVGDKLGRAILPAA